MMRKIANIIPFLIILLVNTSCSDIKTNKTIYDKTGEFSEGFATVSLDGKWGAINKKDEVIIDFKYDYAFGFSEGLAEVRIDGKYGFINETGKVIIPLKYDKADDFSEGKAPVRLNGREFYIDKTGNELP